MSFDVVLCDLRMPGMDGLELLPLLARRLPEATLIMMSAYGTAELAVEALQRGAYDYLAKPFEPSEVVLTLRKAEERERLRRRAALLERDVQLAVGERPIVASSGPMIELLELLERTAAHKTTVPITGESGTGKEVLARAIHDQSPRRRQAFVAVNCGALPEPLLESELFGHAKGAFTGADRARRGLFEEADGGTLFLDEIGELPLPLQVKLLRVLQEEEIRPVGTSKSRRIGGRGSRRPRGGWRRCPPGANPGRTSTPASTSGSSRCRRSESVRSTSRSWWTTSSRRSARASASPCARSAPKRWSGWWPTAGRA